MFYRLEIKMNTKTGPKSAAEKAKVYLMIFLIAFTLGFVVMSLLGCQNMHMRTVDDQPIVYQQGYDAGCRSGYYAGGNPYYGFKKDVVRYVEDGLYQQGWDDGHTVCLSQYEANSRMFN